jgi:glycosyltransferase involved in cell wall biosynthesis
LAVFGPVYRFFSAFLKKLLPNTLYTSLQSVARDALAIKRTSLIDTSLPAGINLVGYLLSGMGLGEGGRLLLNAIKTAEIPVHPFYFSTRNISAITNKKLERTDAGSDIYRTTLVHVNPDQYKLFETDLPRCLWKDRYVIGYLLWELSKVPETWTEGIGFIDEIWTPSKFISDAFASRNSKPVVTIPYGIPLRAEVKKERVLFKLNNDVFYFLIMYDVLSVIERKNPVGAIEAFIKAFTPADDHVGIVVKINNSRQAPREAATLRAMLSMYKNVRFIEESLSRDEVDSLLVSCDAIVSLHRAEGFGLVLAEAMSFGKPVVATNWSANTEFMDESNSCPVSYKLVALGKNYGHYRAEQGNYWAEPDLDHAAALMRRLVDDSEYRRVVGEKAREKIATDLSPDASGRRIVSRLKELGLWE